MINKIISEWKSWLGIILFILITIIYIKLTEPKFKTEQEKDDYYREQSQEDYDYDYQIVR